MRVLSIQTVARADSLCLPFLKTPISAGFPSPADDHLQSPLNLNDLVVRCPAATFYVRVKGDSMEPCGIFTNDVLVVDRSLDPADGSVIVAVLDGEFTVKRFRKSGKNIMLVADNSDYPPIAITEAMDFLVWGVVTYVVHGLQP